MKRSTGGLGIAIAAFLLSFAGGGDLAGQVRAGAETLPSPPGSSYRLALGDVLDLKFPYHSEFNATVTIRPDGYISLVMIGEVRAEGRTPLELATVINDSYTRVVRNPNAAVIVREFTPQRVAQAGEVVAPGAVDLHGRVTSLQAILKTGGLKTSAKVDAVLLTRYTDDNHAEVRTLNLKRVLEGRESDAVLQPYDVLYVPTSKIGKVGLFMEQYVNSVIPRNLLFPYNLNTTVVTVR